MAAIHGGRWDHLQKGMSSIYGRNSHGKLLCLLMTRSIHGVSMEGCGDAFYQEKQGSLLKTLSFKFKILPTLNCYAQESKLTGSFDEDKSPSKITMGQRLVVLDTDFADS